MTVVEDRLRALLLHRRISTEPGVGVAVGWGDPRNRVVNPSFELDTAPWTINQSAGWGVPGTLTRVNGTFGRGDWVGQVTATNAADGATRITGIRTGFLPASPGEQLPFGVRCRAQDPAAAGAGSPGSYVVLSAYDAANAALPGATWQTAVTNDGDMHEHEGVTTPLPAGTASVRLQLNTRSVVAGDTIDVRWDMAYVGVDEYIDGDMPNYAWAGPPHNSETLSPTEWASENDVILDALTGGFADAMERLGMIAYGDPDAGVSGERYLRDPSVAPDWALPHAALYMGARMPGRAAGESEENYLARARDAVVYPFGIKRGTHEAVRRALAPYLTGTKTVYISDDYGGPYDLYVRTLPGETPDVAKARKVLEGDYVSGGEPGAIRAEQLLTYVASAGIAWLEATGTWGGVPAGVTWGNVTLSDVT